MGKCKSSEFDNKTDYQIILISSWAGGAGFFGGSIYFGRELNLHGYNLAGEGFVVSMAQVYRKISG